MRESALKLLLKTFSRGGWSNYLFENFISSNAGLAKRDKAFLKALYFGVLRQSIFLDYFIAKRSKRKLQKLSEKILNILRLGLYQVVFMERVPPHAVVNESVNLARKHGHEGSAKFVNALMRRFCSESLENFKINVDENSKAEDVATALSHPVWMAKRYLDTYGFETAVEIMKANNKIPPQNFRVNDKLEFEKHNLRFERNRFSCIGLEIESGNAVVTTKLVKKGVISPQDQSSLVAVSLFSGFNGSLLELCAGRGNKSAALSMVLGSSSRVTSLDSSFGKLRELRLLGIKNDSPVCADASQSLPFKALFDAVFIDAPCSNMGTVRRHPEMKYRESKKAIEGKSRLQSKLLTNAAGFVDAGGLLVYAVCSFEPEESDAVIKEFLERDSSFKLLDIGKREPELAKAGLTCGSFLKVFPGYFGMDGFFAAMMEKRK